MNLPETYPKAYLCRRIVQAKLFIDRHFEERLDVANIADEACFSKFHFLRQFKVMYGCTPHQYLTKVRILKAKELLQQGMPVTDACLAVGFESASSFAGLFRRATGVSASGYRKHFLERQKHMQVSPLHFIPHCFAQKKGWSE